MLRYGKKIIACLLVFLFVCFVPAAPVRARETVQVSDFAQLTDALERLKSTGGAILLTQDVTVPSDASYTYINAAYRKQITLDTGGHTIVVEGSLTLWPYLSIRADDADAALMRVRSGGQLRLVSVALDAGEDGVAIVREPGSILTCGSETSLGLPAFSCVGRVEGGERVTAAAYWRNAPETLPVVCVQPGAAFDADMLPASVRAFVNRDYAELEEDVSVLWDASTFPLYRQRTLVRGTFASGYDQYAGDAPCCLVVFASDTAPFFLDAYLEAITPQFEMAFLHGEAPQAGTVRLQGSQDGETWRDIDGTEGYAPVTVEKDGGFSWVLTYDGSEEAQKTRPRYYRLVHTAQDGAVSIGDALELGEDFIFTAADIEGGRGGETGFGTPPSPSQTQNGGGYTPQTQLPQPDQSPGDAMALHGAWAASDAQASAAQEPTQSAAPQDTPAPAQSAAPSQTPDALQDGDASQSASGAVDRTAGAVIAACILIFTVAAFVLFRKKDA